MRLRRSTLVVLVGLLLGCGGKAVVDGPAAGGGGTGGAGGSTTSSSPSSGTTSSSGTTTTSDCPSWLVDDNTPCDTVGLVCPGEGSDPYCWDWTCTCQPDWTFECQPGVCE